MLIGGKKTSTPPTGTPGDVSFDTTTAQFEDAVLKASMDVPVLVDFWAPWCGPCKQLMPVLEAAVAAAGGKVKLAKINIDENPELAQALRVQSVPTVYAFYQGQPVTAFTGVRPQSEIAALIDQLAKLAQQGKPDAIDIPATLKLAAESMNIGDIPTAQGHYIQVLGQDENNAPAYAGLIRSYVALPDFEQAQYMIDDAPEAIAKHPEFAAAKTALELALELAQNAPAAGATDTLKAAIDKNPNDHAARFDYAMALFAAGQRGDAIDQLLDIMRRDKANEKKWEDDKARAQILKFFEAMGQTDPETLSGRRKLSSLLFS